MQSRESIEVFQDVSFAFPKNDVDGLRSGLRQVSQPPWAWAEDWESDVMSRTDSDVAVIAFKRDALDHEKAVYVSLLGTSDSKWSIPNVIPQDSGNRLTVHEYNDFVDEFLVRVLIPLLHARQIEARVSPRYLSIDDMFDAAAARSLEAFLSIGPYCGSALHPSDEERLNQFIWKLHESKREFDCDLLARYLREALNWPEESAGEIATRVDRGIELLRCQRSA